MRHSFLGTKSVLALALAGMLAIGPALSKPDKDKGERADKGDHPKGHQKAEKGERRHSDSKSARDKGGPAGARLAHFEGRHSVVVRDYYNEQFRAGRCPPGLAKKHNGCMPPGQAKKWNVGQPLPREVVYYSVPQPLLVQIGPPPSGYRYVRVASDILMISIGSRIVVDVIIGS